MSAKWKSYLSRRAGGAKFQKENAEPGTLARAAKTCILLPNGLRTPEHPRLLLAHRRAFRRTSSHDLASSLILPIYPPPSPGATRMAYSSPSLNPRHAPPRLWLLFGGLVVLAFLLWPSTTSSLPTLAELSPSFANHFPSLSSSPSPLRVDLSTGPVPVAEEAVEPDAKWWQDVSIVYTWVNGSETSFLEDKQAVTGEDIGSNRFRDDGLFKYSVRSIERYMPWHTGEIILLSRRNHVPDWIDVSHPR